MQRIAQRELCNLSPSLLPLLRSHPPLSNVFQPRPRECPFQYVAGSPRWSTAYLWPCVWHALVCSVVSISLSTIISEALLKRSHFSGLLCFCFQLFLVSVLGICTGGRIGPCNNLLVSFHFKLMTTAGSARYIQVLQEHFSGDIYRALGTGETTLCCNHQFSSLTIFFTLLTCKGILDLRTHTSDLAHWICLSKA